LLIRYDNKNLRVESARCVANVDSKIMRGIDGFLFHLKVFRQKYSNKKKKKYKKKKSLKQK
jgi:hypothetical protein